MGLTWEEYQSLQTNQPTTGLSTEEYENLIRPATEGETAFVQPTSREVVPPSPGVGMVETGQYALAENFPAPLLRKIAKWMYTPGEKDQERLMRSGYLNPEGRIDYDKFEVLKNRMFSPKSEWFPNDPKDWKALTRLKSLEQIIQPLEAGAEKFKEAIPEMSILPRAGAKALTFPGTLSSFFVGGLPFRAVAPAAGAAFKLMPYGQRIGSATERLAVEIPSLVEGMTSLVGTFAGGGALLETGQPGATPISVLKAAGEEGEVGLAMMATGGAASAVAASKYNPFKSQLARWAIPFTAQAETMVAYPAIKEGYWPDMADVITTPLFLGGLEAMRFSPKNIKRMAQVEVEEMLQAGEVNMRPTKELYEPAKGKMTAEEWIDSVVSNKKIEDVKKLAPNTHLKLGDMLGESVRKEIGIPRKDWKKVLDTKVYYSPSMKGEAKGELRTVSKKMQELSGYPEYYVAFGPNADWKTPIHEGTHVIQYERGIARKGITETHRKRLEAATGRLVEKVGKGYERHNEEVTKTNEFIRQTYKDAEKDPQLAGLFKAGTKQAKATIGDHIWYKIAKKYTDPSTTRMIGMRRGVIAWPKSIHKLHQNNLIKITNALEATGVTKDFIKKEFYGGKPLGPKNFSLNEVKNKQTELLNRLIEEKIFIPITGKKADPAEKFLEFYYYPRGAKSRKILSIMPVEEAMRLSALPEVDKTIWPHRWRSSRWAREGENIVPDVEQASMKISKIKDVSITGMHHAAKSGKYDPERAVAYSKSIARGKPDTTIEGLTPGDIAWGKLIRTTFDKWVANPEIAESVGLKDYRANIRKIEEYMTAMHKFNQAEIEREFKFFEKIPGKVTAGFTKKRYQKEVMERRDIPKALLTYEYLAARKVYWEPLLGRVKERIKHLPQKRGEHAIQYFKEVMGIQQRLYPETLEWVSRALAARYFSGLMGFSYLGAPIRNTTQKLVELVDIPPKHVAKGIKDWMTNPVEKARARESGVAEQWKREYFETANPHQFIQKTVTKIDDVAMWGFGTSEVIMRESAYLGYYDHFMSKKGKVDVRRFPADTRELIDLKMKQGKVEEAADIYGKAGPLRVHYGYGIEHTWPGLKTWQGRAGFQYWSYPLFTGETWVETFKRGDVKRGMAMMGLQPLIYLAGRPLGVWTAGFVMMGLAPTLAPTARFIAEAIYTGGLWAQGQFTEKNEEKFDKHARELKKMSWALLPGGRFFYTRAYKFAETMANSDFKNKQLWTMNEYTQRLEKTTWDDEIKKLLDWRPYDKAMESKWGRKMATAESNWNYLRSRAYSDFTNGLVFMHQRKLEKYNQLIASAMEKFKESGQPPRKEVIKLIMKYKYAKYPSDAARVWQRILRNKPAAMRFIRTLDERDRDDFYDFLGLEASWEEGD